MCTCRTFVYIFFYQTKESQTTPGIIKRFRFFICAVSFNISFRIYSKFFVRMKKIRLSRSLTMFADVCVCCVVEKLTQRSLYNFELVYIPLIYCDCFLSLTHYELLLLLFSIPRRRAVIKSYNLVSCCLFYHAFYWH